MDKDDLKRCIEIVEWLIGWPIRDPNEVTANILELRCILEDLYVAAEGEEAIDPADQCSQRGELCRDCIYITPDNKG